MPKADPAALLTKSGGKAATTFFLLSPFSVFFSTIVDWTFYDGSPFVSIEHIFYCSGSIQLGPLPRLVSTSYLVSLEVFTQALLTPSTLQVSLHRCVFSHAQTTSAYFPESLTQLVSLHTFSKIPDLVLCQLWKPPPFIKARGLLVSLLTSMFPLRTKEQSVHLKFTLRLCSLEPRSDLSKA